MVTVTICEASIAYSFCQGLARYTARRNAFYWVLFLTLTASPYTRSVYQITIYFSVTLQYPQNSHLDWYPSTQLSYNPSTESQVHSTLNNKPPTGFRPFGIRISQRYIIMQQQSWHKFGHFHPTDIATDASTSTRSKSEEETVCESQ